MRNFSLFLSKFLFFIFDNIDGFLLIKNILFSISGTTEEYLEYTSYTMLPQFPLVKPAEFQILESDCKINKLIAMELKQKFLECQTIDYESFLNENLSDMLTNMTASVYSWTGLQGNIAINKFKVIEILMGKLNLILYFILFGNIFGI